MLLLGGIVVVLVEAAEVIIYINDKRYARNHPDPYAGLADDELSPIDEPRAGRRGQLAQLNASDAPGAPGHLGLKL